MTSFAAAALAGLLIATPAAAREIAGVTLPETVTVEGKRLVLNGAGVRTRFLVKVYVIGLYLERPASDAAAVLALDSMRRADLHVLRSLSTDEITSAIRTAFVENAGSAMPGLEERLKRLESMIPDAKPGDTVTLAYVPGRGTVIVGKGEETGVIEGKDFADVLFAVWIGAHPVDPALRQALLAGGQ